MRIAFEAQAAHYILRFSFLLDALPVASLASKVFVFACACGYELSHFEGNVFPGSPGESRASPQKSGRAPGSRFTKVRARDEAVSINHSSCGVD